MTKNLRLRARVAAMVALMLVALAIIPAAASAMDVTASTTRPNGFAGQDTYGGKPTRLTWELRLKEGDAAVSALEIVMPDGTNLSKSGVTVITLKGLQRTSVKSETKIDGQTMHVTFSQPVEPAANIRLTVEQLVLPSKGGTFQITGTATTASGTVPLPPAPTDLVYKPMTVAEGMIFWLDQQPWVAAWNSVNFLKMFFKPQIIVASIFVQFKGWLVAIALVAIGFPLAIPIGLALAFAKMSKIAPIRWISSTYVNIIRGTPLFLQIYIAFFGLPLIGIQGNKYVLGIIVLALNSSAYLAEIFRAGIQSISRGQFEAASSLGMTYWQAMQNVIVPQTVKRVLPTMTSEFILLYKDTAMLSAVGVFELMMYSKNLSAITGNVTPYVVAAGFYLIVTTPLIYYVRTLEERLAVAEGGATPKPKKPKRFKWKPSSAGTDAALLATSAEHESR
jgi:polar amino acid transport system substrate-binding protein